MSSRFIRSDGTGLGVKMAPGAKVSRTSASPSKLGASDGLDVSGRTAPMAQPALMREDRMRAKAEASANSKTHIQGEENGAGECLRMPGAEHSKQFEAQQDWGVGSKPNNKPLQLAQVTHLAGVRQGPRPKDLADSTAACMNWALPMEAQRPKVTAKTVRERVVPPWVMDRRDNEFGEERAAVEAARPTPKTTASEKRAMMNRIKMLSKELSATSLSRKALESQLKELQALKTASMEVDKLNPVGISAEN